MSGTSCTMDIKHLYFINPQQFIEEIKVLSMEPGEVALFISYLFPSQAGHAGEFLSTNGSIMSWQPVSGGIFPFGIDGGAAMDTYLISQNLEGGSANSVYFPSQIIDGGNA